MPPLTLQEAARLARKAADTRGDGTRRRPAQRAWAALCAAGDAGDQAAVTALWQSWVAGPRNDFWQLLVRWRGAGQAAEDACGAAMAPGGDAAAAFCARHRLVPADPARRAVFFLLTGQAAALQAADPDSSLLSLGYAATADENGRARIREAMAAARRVSLVKVVTGGDARRRIPPLTGAEIGYLAGQLTQRGDLAGLWQLTADLPLTDAVPLMGTFGQWQPADTAGRALFRALTLARASTDPAVLARARGGMSNIRADGAPLSERISLPGFGRMYVTQGQLTADGRQLAVAGDRPGAGHLGVNDIAVISLRDSAAPGALQQYQADGLVWTMAFAGDRLLAASAVPPERDHRRYQLTSFAAGRVTPLSQIWDSGVSFTTVAPWYAQPGGFIGCGPHRLMFYTASDELAATAATHHESWQTQLDTGCWVAAHPDGLLAMANGGGLAVFDAKNPAQPGPLATAPLPEDAPVRFCGPDRLITLGDGQVQLWQFDGTRLEQLAARPVKAAGSAVIPGQDLIVLCGYNLALRFLDAGTLADAAPPEGMLREADGVWNSPSLDRCVLFSVGEDEVGVVEVVDQLHPAAAAAAKPPSQWAPADLAAVSGAADRAASGGPEWELLDLLRRCLEWRFGTGTGQ